MSDVRARLLAPAAALIMGAAALSACQRAPYPEAGMASEPPPAADAPELLGAPDDPNLPPPPAYPPGPDAELPPAPERPGDAPAPYAALAPAPPRVITMAPIPNPPERGSSRARNYARYRGGDVGARSAGPGVISMAPIPNPREGGARAARVRDGSGARTRSYIATPRAERQQANRAERRRQRRAERRSRVVAAPSQAAPVRRPAAPPAAQKSRPQATAPARPAPAATPRATPAARNPAAPVPRTEAPARLPVPTPAPAVRKATPEPRRVTAPAPVQVAKPAPAKPTPVTQDAKSRSGRELTSRTPSAAPTADRASKISALSGALGSTMLSRAALRGADTLKTGTPGDVSLTVPQDFAQELRDQAKRSGLSDAAASAALTAKLSGDGYAVSPAGAQTQALTAGKPTEFRWTVTKMDAARGPLQADVGADLLGGGKQHLDLAVLTSKAAATAEGFKLSPRMLGAGLLLLVVILAGALLGGGRRDRRRTATVRDERT